MSAAGVPTRYDVYYFPSFEYWCQLHESHDYAAYSAYPVLSRSDLSLAEAQAFVAGSGRPEFYEIRLAAASAEERAS
jgi:hypothetical protein